MAWIGWWWSDRSWPLLVYSVCMLQTYCKMVKIQDDVFQKGEQRRLKIHSMRCGFKDMQDFNKSLMAAFCTSSHLFGPDFGFCALCLESNTFRPFRKLSSSFCRHAGRLSGDPGRRDQDTVTGGGACWPDHLQRPDGLLLEDSQRRGAPCFLERSWRYAHGVKHNYNTILVIDLHWFDHKT